jgi:hypothetical protein
MSITNIVTWGFGPGSGPAAIVTFGFAIADLSTTTEGIFTEVFKSVSGSIFE